MACTNRTDVNGNATWTYHGTKKHAVATTGSGGAGYSYDANGNMTSRNGQSISWSSFNYPTTLNTATETTNFYYGPDRQYYKQVYTGPSYTETTHYVGGLLEKVYNSSTGVTDWRHSITADGQVVAIVSRPSSGSNAVYYPLEDNQGSGSTLTNSSGTSLVRQSYNAFGLPRDGADWDGAEQSGDQAIIDGISRRGYTGHSMLGGMGLIHMNGRVQDAITGRFLSPDPNIPNPGFTQSYNRYAYVNNNPLSFVDPSGFGEKCLACTYVFGDPSSVLEPGAAPADELDEVTVTGIRAQPTNGYERNQQETICFAGRQPVLLGGFVLTCMGEGDIFNGHTDMYLGDSSQLFSTGLGAATRIGQPKEAAKSNTPPPQSAMVMSVTTPQGYKSVINNIKGAVDAVGILAAKEYANVLDGKWLGKNGKWYSLNWGGNGWTGARSLAVGRAELWNALGKTAFFISAPISLLQGWNSASDRNWLGVAKSGNDIAWGAAAVYGGAAGAAGSITYTLTSGALENPGVYNFLVTKPVDFACSLSGC